MDPGLQSTNPTFIAHGLSCSTDCGIFLDQGSKPCLLHWQADSWQLSHQESSFFCFVLFCFYWIGTLFQKLSFCSGRHFEVQEPGWKSVGLWDSGTREIQKLSIWTWPWSVWVCLCDPEICPKSSKWNSVSRKMHLLVCDLLKTGLLICKLPLITTPVNK